MEQSRLVMVKSQTDQRGQALIENLICLVALKLFVAGFLFLAYQLVLTKWVDFWSYRTLVCLIEREQIYFCENQLKEKLHLLLSPQDYKVQELWITSKKTKIKLQLSVARYGKKTYEHSIDLPLHSSSMRTAPL